MAAMTSWANSVNMAAMTSSGEGEEGPAFTLNCVALLGEFLDCNGTVCMRERQRDRESVYICVCERERADARAVAPAYKGV
jgi:hypothetical protein